MGMFPRTQLTNNVRRGQINPQMRKSVEIGSMRGSYVDTYAAATRS